MSNSNISIIVPVYNVEEYLRKCVDSLLSQTYRHIEIILVDDGSTDSSGEICDEYATRSNRVRAIHTENRGLSAARNRGLEEAVSTYISFVDSDDWVEEEMYTTLLRNIVGSKADISCVGVKSDYNEGQDILKKTDDVIECNTEEFLRVVIENPNIYGYVCNKLFKRDLLQELKFDEELRSCEDLDFTVRYATVCKKAVYIESELYHYRQRATSMTGDLGYNDRKLSILDAYEAIMPIYQKYCPECMYRLNRNYLKININILGRMRRSHYRNDAVHKRLTENIEQTYSLVMNDRHNSSAVRFNIWISKRIPGLSLWAKQMLLKRHSR